ncbi:MAG: methyltransferase domain-containing protein [Candidatus Eremiobacteraeota bacterium]|nr:methyltransferase domain-containing protein [Candidatus Eremiobacteraeota bacterium]
MREGLGVLDVGCGTGDDVRAMAQIVGPSGRACGVDASAAMIAEAQKRGVSANVSFAQADAGVLPFDDAAFDAVRAERLFQHLIKPEGAAAELRRVTRAGGKVFLIDPDWETLVVAGADARITRQITSALVEGVANPFAGRNALGLLRRAGFRTVVASAIASAPPLATAYELFLGSAVDLALNARHISREEAATWLANLTEAEQHGEFFCAVLSVATLATA